MMLERKVITEAMTSYEQNEDMQKEILKKKLVLLELQPQFTALLELLKL